MVTNRAGEGADSGAEALVPDALVPEVQPASSKVAATTITHTQRVP